MRVMGIDPGSNCTGYGIVEEIRGSLQAVHWGSIKSKSSAPFPDRLKAIYDKLVLTIQKFNPHEVAVEDLFFASNAKTALKLGQTRGAILLAAVNENKPIAEYTPLEVKQAVVGYGRAEKEQVQDMVTALLKLKEKPEPFDSSDALAIAICHLHAASANERLQAQGT